ncbi:hypothetical protein ACQJBY_056896 [Aegilops geniculata]
MDSQAPAGDDRRSTHLNKARLASHYVDILKLILKLNSWANHVPIYSSFRFFSFEQAVDEQSPRQSAPSKQAGAPCVYLKKGTCAEGSMRHDAHGHAPHLAASHAH